MTLFVGAGYVYASPGAGIDRVPTGGGTLEPFGPASSTAFSVVADDENVYWDTMGAPQQLLTSSQTGSKTSVIDVPPQTLSYFFVDESRIYWTADAATLHVQPIEGGTESVIPFSRADSQAPIVLQDGRVLGEDCVPTSVDSKGAVVAGYFMAAGDSACYELHGSCGQSYACGDLVGVPIGGGTRTVLAKAKEDDSQEFDTRRMMSDELGVYFLWRKNWPDNGNLHRRLVRVPFSGGSPIELTTDDDDVFAFVVAPDRLYWEARDHDLRGTIKSMPKYAP